jgi:hypothetical protein
MKKRQNISALFTIAVFYLILESVFGITCPILFLTGISCAGCGMSRAWFCVLRMDFTGAFRYHPLFWILPIGIMLFLFWDKIPKKINRKGASFSEAPLLCVFFVYAIIISPKYGYAILFGTIFFVLKHNVFGDIS